MFYNHNKGRNKFIPNILMYILACLEIKTQVKKTCEFVQNINV